MAKTYTTRQGDAWDAIAHRVYGDVSLTGWLMQNNYKHLETFVFGPGVVLNTPDPPADAADANTPSWRTET